MDNDPDYFIDGGYTKEAIYKANQAYGDYAVPDTLDDVDKLTTKNVIDRIEHELYDV